MDNDKIESVEQLAKYLGRVVTVGKWVTVTQDMVNRFAAATGDSQYIHVDPDRAKETPFGGTIAHGYLTLSLLEGYLAERAEGPEIDLGGRMLVNYGLNKVRFPAAVPVGKRIRVHIKLLGIEEGPGGEWAQVTTERTVELEGSTRPALIAENILRTYF